jgi:hypothetical protein
VLTFPLYPYNTPCAVPGEPGAPPEEHVAVA